MKQLTCCLLDAFRLPPLHQSQSTQSEVAALHTTAVAKLAQDSCVLQHHALQFVASLLLAEPGTLKHLRAEGLWGLAFGKLFFFWGNAEGKASQGDSPFAFIGRMCADIQCMHGGQASFRRSVKEGFFGEVNCDVSTLTQPKQEHTLTATLSSAGCAL